MLPTGQFRAKAIQVELPEGGHSYVQFGESGKKGTPQAAVNFQILDEGEFKGRTIAWIGYFTEATVQRTVEALRFCGFTGNDLEAAMTQKLDQEVEIVVDHEEYNGKIRAKVKWVNKLGGGMLRLQKQMDRNQLKAFSAMMKASVAEVPAGGMPREQKPRSTTSAAVAAGWSNPDDSGPPIGGDDEIPF